MTVRLRLCMSRLHRLGKTLLYLLGGQVMEAALEGFGAQDLSFFIQNQDSEIMEAFCFHSSPQSLPPPPRRRVFLFLQCRKCTNPDCPRR